MNNYIPENIECFFSSDEDDDDDDDEELVRVTNRVVATSGIEKALSVSMDFEPSSAFYKKYNPTYSNSDLPHRNSTYHIVPEVITYKNGDKVFFEGKQVDYPTDFQKWNKNTQDNWKQAVRNEALRPFHISLLQNK